MNQFFISLIIVFSAFESFSQIHPEHKRANHWFFGEDESGVGGVHLDFNSGTIEVGTSPVIGAAGASQTTISDTAGNFLFFYNGNFIMNNEFDLIEGGEEVYGHEFSPNGAMFLPVPENDSLYLLFYSSCWDNNFYGGLRYALIDSKANGGLGKVLSYDNLILTGATGSISATYHENGKDFWLISADTSSYLHSFLIDNTGVPQHIDSQKIITVSSLFGTPICKIIPVFTTRPEGDLIAVSSIDLEDGFNSDYSLSIIRFNNQTGNFNTELLIEDHAGELVEGDFNPLLHAFSPNGDWLYVPFNENPLPRNGYIKRYGNLYGSVEPADIISEIVFETETHQAPYTIQCTPVGSMLYYSLPGDDNPGSMNTPYISEILYPDSTNPVVLHNNILTDVYFTLSPNNNLPPHWYYRPTGFTNSSEKTKYEPLLCFPNPVNDKLYFLNGFTDIEEVKFVNYLGEELTGTILNNYEIDVSRIKNGIYILKIRLRNNLLKTTKIIVQH